MTVRSLLVAALLVASSASLLRAQTTTPEKPPIDISRQPEQPQQRPKWNDPLSGSVVGMWGFPVGAFRRNEDGGGGGIVDIGYALGRAQMFSLHASVGYLLYGYVSGSRDVPVYDQNGYYQGYYQNVSYAVRNHAMWSFDAGPQIDFLNARWRPYAFGSVGLSYFASHMNVQPPTSNIDQGQDVTIFAHSNLAWSAGTGIRIGGTDPRKGAFQLGISFRRNARAQYANDKAMRVQTDSSVTLTPFSGSANLIIISAGFWIGPLRR